MIFKKIGKKLLVYLIKIREKTFIIGKNELKYLFIKNSSDCLIISFSGFAPAKNKSSYNYIRTLSDIKVNKLFILDDFGYEKRGSYYLGECGNFYVSEMVIQLIEKIKAENKINKIICIGSSKGGTAAIKFGLQLGVEHIIAGAPQYYIGNYLSANNEHKKILESVMGNVDKQGISFLNEIVHNAIANYNFPTKPIIYLHYSYNEHTYSEHIKYLINDLKESNYVINEDVKTYIEHSDCQWPFENPHFWS
jgi:hypothetical protein